MIRGLLQTPSLYVIGQWTVWLDTRGKHDPAGHYAYMEMPSGAEGIHAIVEAALHHEPFIESVPFPCACGSSHLAMGTMYGNVVMWAREEAGYGRAAVAEACTAGRWPAAGRGRC